MRYALAVAVMLTAAPAAAEPWAQHPYLSRSEVDLAETPDEGPSGARKVTGYFERLDRAGFNCDVKDRSDRHVAIRCTNGRGNVITYGAQFVGVGYLDITDASVDGHHLNKAALIRHQTSVWNGELRSPNH